MKEKEKLLLQVPVSFSSLFYIAAPFGFLVYFSPLRQCVAKRRAQATAGKQNETKYNKNWSSKVCSFFFFPWPTKAKVCKKKKKKKHCGAFLTRVSCLSQSAS